VADGAGDAHQRLHRDAGHERIEVEDTAVACLRFANGASASSSDDERSPRLPKTIAIHGDRGSAVIEQDDVLRLGPFAAEAPEDKATKDALRAEGRRVGRLEQPGGDLARRPRPPVGRLVRAIQTNTPRWVDGREVRKAVA